MSDKIHYSLLLICFSCLYPLGLILIGHICLEMCPFLLSFLIYWHITLQNILSGFL
jgi:hypothetical protein